MDMASAAYTKQWLKIDELMKKPSDFVSFGETNERTGEYMSVRTQEQLEVVKENIRLNARTADHRATIEGSINPLVILAQLWTFVTGRQAQLQTASAVLKMIVGDINAELLVVTAGGQDKMSDYYVRRYYSTPESKALTRKMECAFDPATIEAVVHDGATTDEERNFSCANSGVGAQAQVRGTHNFFNLIDQRSTDQLQNFMLAAQKEAALNAQTRVDKAKGSIIKGLKGLK